MSWTETPDGAGGWVRTGQPVKRWPWPKRIIGAALLVVTILGVTAVVVGNREPSYSWGELMDDPKPVVLDLGNGVKVRTMCGAQGQRIYATEAITDPKGGLVSLSMPGALAVIADKGCP